MKNETASTSNRDHFQTRGATRVLIVSTVSIFIETFLIPFADFLKAKGFYVDAAARGIIASLNVARTFDQRFEISWTRSPRNLISNLRGLGEIRSLLGKQSYSIVHVHTHIAALITRLALITLPRARRPRLIYTAHGFFFHRHGSRISNLIYIAIEWLAGKWCDHLVVINQEDFEAAKRYQIVHRSRLSYIRGVGIDVEQLIARAANGAGSSQLRVELGIPEQAPIVLMISEYNPGKRHRDLIAALAHTQRSDYHLLLVGSGPLEAQCRTLVEQLGLRSRVHFLGFRHDVPSLLKSADLLVHPSEREGLSVCVQEALALGVPVIGARARGVEELLVRGAGLLFEIGDQLKLAELIDQLLSDPDQRARLGEQGKTEAEQLSRSAIYQRYWELYQRLLLQNSAVQPTKLRR